MKNSKIKSKEKKQIDETVMAKFQDLSDEENQHKNKRRLKKMSDIKENERMVEEEEEYVPDMIDEELEVDFKQFKILDDQDIINQKKQLLKKQNNKKLKGNQQIDKFIQENVKPDLNKIKKQGKKIQLTLDQIMKIKKSRNKRKDSSDFIVSDNAQVSDEQPKKIEKAPNYQKYNGSNQDEDKLIEKAMKMSLTASTSRKKEERYQDLDSYMFDKDEKISQVKIEKEKEKENIRSKSKSKPKVSKPLKLQVNGPLEGFHIAFTGQFQNFSKDQLIELVGRLGGQTPKSITKKCNLLFQGAFAMDHFKRRLQGSINQTSKSREALSKKIRIIAHDDIDDFFVEKTGKTVTELIDENDKKSQKRIANNHQTQKQQKYEVKPQKDQTLEKVQTKSQSLLEGNSDDTIKLDILPIKNNCLLWTEKYKPKDLSQVIGQASQIRSLRQWLESWEDIQLKGNKREVKDFRGGAFPSGNINSKAALLSGDPGLGKTTTARLIAAEFNYLVSQFNASDIRNKKGINLLQSNSFSLDIGRNLQKSLIIMDQVDGMSSGDRGGISQIIKMIKTSKVPIICICNDRHADKIKSLAGHCNDIKFHKPNKMQIVRRLKQIVEKEGGVSEQRALERLVETFQNDIRQVISYLELMFKTTKHITSASLSVSSTQAHTKDASVMINHFEVARKLLNRVQFRSMNLNQRVSCFFIDSDMVPLMIHENILNSCKKSKFTSFDFDNLKKAFKGISVSDQINQSIRKKQEYGLMPVYGFLSSIYPTEKISQSIGFPSFPAWLGKNSSQRKNRKLIKELKNRILPITLNGSSKTAKHQYVVVLFNEILHNLKNEKIQQTIDLMQTYNISPTMLNQHLTCLQYNPEKVNLMASVSTPTKAKLTRMYNKRHEDAKLKGVKLNKNLKAQHLKFDPVLQQVQDIAEENQQEQPNEEDQSKKIQSIVGKGKAKAGKSKPKKK